MHGIPAFVMLALIASGSGLGQVASSHAQPSTARFSEPGSFVRAFSGGAVAADHALASKAGADMLRRGGNAVDAAVAASFTLSVVRPFSCGIGGGGFMVVRLSVPRFSEPGASVTEIALNYREQAPACAVPDYYERLAPTRPDAATRGGTAVAIPGTSHGLLHALSMYGTLDRAAVLAPAIDAAERGFVVDEAYLRAVREDVLPGFEKDPSLRTRFAFLWERFLREGKVALGDTITLPEQASALRLIADRGAEAFTKGPLADAIVASIAKDGGALTHADLGSFRVQPIEPLRTSWMGCRVLTMPPPSSGGLVLAQVFSTLTARPERLADLGHNTPAYVHVVAEAGKHAFADRARWLADPAFVSLPMNNLLDPAMLAARAGTIKTDGVLPDDSYGWRPAPATKPVDDGGTSHISVVDSKGNAVACTETINLVFGSWLAVEGFGFCLNNEMDDFLTVRGKPNAFGLAQADANLPAPGKRPLSSMSPTILLNPDGTVRAVVGASGGPRIISATLQAILSHMVFGYDAGDAVRLPRFHHQWMPAVLGLEPTMAQTDEPQTTLRRLGHKTQSRTWGDVGVVQMITSSPNGWSAASDPRKGGTPDGVEHVIR
jgi:gamma-glutamyltranspeptidase/glutathione hydrolase